MRADQIECAQCGATPGRPCLRPGGSTLSVSFHRVRLRSEGLDLPCDECGVEAGYLCRDDDDVALGQQIGMGGVGLRARVCAGSVRDTAPKFVKVKAEPTHATITAYNAGCRCAECSAAKRAYCLARKAIRKSAGVPPAKHGTYAGYESYGCRCQPCRRAKAIYRMGSGHGLP